jgi:serine/threonine protein kinase
MEGYTITKETIGSGSFGSVRRAVNKQKDEVAIKITSYLHLLSAIEVESYMRESIILGRLSHPNVIKYLDHFRYGNYHNLCIAMEYANGGSLE